MWRVSPSGLTRRRFIHANVRRDIHSFPSLHSSISLRVEITTCPNCCRKSARKAVRISITMYVFLFLHVSIIPVLEKNLRMQIKTEVI